MRASLCESELCRRAAIASCHAASQRAAFCCVPPLRLRCAAVVCCRAAAALLRASAALRQGYVHNCAHDRVMVQFSRCALLATRRFSLF